MIVVVVLYSRYTIRYSFDLVKNREKRLSTYFILHFPNTSSQEHQRFKRILCVY